MDRVDRDTFVNAMEQSSEIEFGGQVEGREAIALDPKGGKGLGIRSAGHQIGNGMSVRILRLKRRAHGIDARTLEGNLEGDVVIEKLHVDLRTREITHAGRNRKDAQVGFMDMWT